MEQRDLAEETKNQWWLETWLERGFSQEDGCVDAVEEGWNQALFFVLNVINSVTNDAQVWEISKGCKTLYVQDDAQERGRVVVIMETRVLGW